MGTNVIRVEGQPYAQRDFHYKPSSWVIFYIAHPDTHHYYRLHFNNMEVDKVTYIESGKIEIYLDGSTAGKGNYAQGDRIFSSIREVVATNEDDRVFCSRDARIYLEAGDDFFETGGGRIEVFGGRGFDTYRVLS